MHFPYALPLRSARNPWKIFNMHHVDTSPFIHRCYLYMLFRKTEKILVCGKVVQPKDFYLKSEFSNTRKFMKSMLLF